jgi:hypothetical protein
MDCNRRTRPERGDHHVALAFVNAGVSARPYPRREIAFLYIFAVETRNGQLASGTLHALGRDVPELDGLGPCHRPSWRTDRVVATMTRPWGCVAYLAGFEFWRGDSSGGFDPNYDVTY